MDIESKKFRDMNKKIVKKTLEYGESDIYFSIWVDETTDILEVEERLKTRLTNFINKIKEEKLWKMDS